MNKDIINICDELRSIANQGLMYSKTDYDSRRYLKILDLTSIALSKNHENVTNSYLNNLTYTSPLIGTLSVIIQNRKILLIQRSDNLKWCIPGGHIEVGESPYEGAMRELKEELGIKAKIIRLLAIFDSRKFKIPSLSQYYMLVFQHENIGNMKIVLGKEALAYNYFSRRELPKLSSSTKNVIEKVLEIIDNNSEKTYFD